MALKEINFNELDEATKNYDKAIRLLDEEIAELNGILVRLDSDWDSPASDTYLEKMRLEDENLKKALRVLKELRKYSNDTKNTFEKIDRFLRSLFIPIANITRL